MIKIASMILNCSFLIFSFAFKKLLFFNFSEQSKSFVRFSFFSERHNCSRIISPFLKIFCLVTKSMPILHRTDTSQTAQKLARQGWDKRRTESLRHLFNRKSKTKHSYGSFLDSPRTKT